MLFRQIFDKESCTYTYLLASGQGREAIIIDPVFDHVQQYLSLIEELELRLVISLDTHTHADHVTGTGKLSQETDCERALGDQSKAEYITLRVREGEKVRADGMTLEALYTPGHTDDSYSFLLDDRIFTGDTLFIRGTGRTDFQNGSALQQYHSIFDKLLTLPEETLVFPAHDYRGMTVSTIGEEKRFNPRLQVKSPQEYIDLMGNLNLDNPKLMDIAVPANLSCGMLWDPQTP